MLNDAIDVQILYQKAKSILAPEVFSFVDSGSGDERALMRNFQCFEQVNLMPRVLCGLNGISTEIKISEFMAAAPLLIAPAAYHCLLSQNGELDMLKAANQFNTIMIVSMFSTIDHKLIAANKKIPVWLQFYLLKDRAINHNILQLAEECRFEALVLTVDAPVYAARKREREQPLKFPSHISFTHLEALGIPVKESIKTKRHLSQLLDPSISWADLDWLAENTNIPIILKGIMDPRDTEIALRYPNVKGIVVSNHGGRQLDSSLSALEVMNQHRLVAGNKIKLFLDGGIRSGSDVFKALALGADAALIGRAALWALTVGGSEAVLKLLSQLKNELHETMALCGCSTVQDISSEFLICKEKL